ncbi:MAG: 2-amino-4-hydroxy-6-hydroxymethyldihydropteridine diphosphokinase [Bacteroidetes bacterium]|nr:2-amino-4-hydroxy-6-hydroxymethyldihydropteridine diphosphokinase [Bacteroidota bacterium]
MNQNICILLGSNLGDARAQLDLAIHLLELKGIAVLHKSSVYKTAAWGKQDQPEFLNQVLLCASECSAEQVLEMCLKTEQAMGRIRTEKWEARIIDIDILLFNDQVIQLPNLQIPHPFLPQRRFSLVPLAELIPDFQHPILKKSIHQLLQDCPDKLEVCKLI